MNSSNVIVNIKNMDDISNITESTKYINISIDNVNNDVIDYFLLNGINYSYSDTINDRNGFIYVSYDIFKYGENIINNIIDNMPDKLNKLEMVRYIYISLGKILCSDINTMDDKNEVVSFNMISTINNIWGALSNGKVNDSVVAKIFMYVCYRMGIKCEFVSSNIRGNIANKVYIDNTFLIVDLFNDIYSIQGGFCTRYFDKFNSDKDIDKKILYIKDEYMDDLLSQLLKEFDSDEENILYKILSHTGKMININSVGAYELFKIYRDIFNSFFPSYDIGINNLFICDSFDNRQHFIVFSYNDNYYSFNYTKRCFVNIDKCILYDNIKNKKVGVYADENFILKENRVIL